MSSPALAAPTISFPGADERTAAQPPEYRGLGRDGVRMLVGAPDAITHTTFAAMAEHLLPGDLVVVNTSATRPAEIDADRGGTPVVAHLGTPLDDGAWVVELRSAPDAAEVVLDAGPGEVVTIAGGLCLQLIQPYPEAPSSPTGAGNRLWRSRLVECGRGRSDLADHLSRHGRPIQYGYLDRPYPLADYQTVFAEQVGSAEMPSAARPFTADLVTRLIARGVGVAPVVLHTGLSSQESGEAPQPEWFSVPAATAHTVRATQARGGRVVAAGTTVTRALESAAGLDGRIGPASGWTTRVVTPQEPPQVVTGLITGWHDPQASHLLLVEAVAGARLAQQAYDAAVAQSYLWHEFGDSALLLPS